MDREKGIAYCGLACCVCGQNAECAGCRSDGCENRGWCKNRSCCRERGLDGCWACPEFPCTGGMLDKARVRAFARFARENGADALMDCLERNERAGVVYHHPGRLVGDYDRPEGEEAALELLRAGERTKKCECEGVRNAE